MNTKTFIEKQVEEIRKAVGGGRAISALSGGVDSSACTVLAHRALGNQLKVIFIDDGLMRQDEPRQVRDSFKKLGISVRIIQAQEERAAPAFPADARWAGAAADKRDPASRDLPALAGYGRRSGAW